MPYTRPKTKPPAISRRRAIAIAVAASTVLAACGGSGSGSEGKDDVVVEFNILGYSPNTPKLFQEAFCGSPKIVEGSVMPPPAGGQRWSRSRSVTASQPSCGGGWCCRSSSTSRRRPAGRDRGR